MSKEKVVGIYGDINAIAADPVYLDVAKDKIGLNRVILGGGFNLSEKTRAVNPCTGKASPGLTLVEDDTPMRKSIDESHKRGMQVWGCISLYWAGAENATDIMAVDLDGVRMDAFPKRTYAAEQAAMTFCPNNDRINDWFESALVEIASSYDFQGYALTHLRYCHPAFIEQMFACGCPTCQKKAREWGYDFPRMKAAVKSTVARLRQARPEELKAAAEAQYGFFDFLQVLGTDATGVIDWFNFRADTMTHNLKRLKAAVKSVRPDFIFGSDTHYPTMAMLVGHHYADMAAVCDQILPLLSHNEIHFMDNIGSFASYLCECVPGLEDRVAVSLVYNLLGIRTPGMPETVAEMKLGNPPTSETTMNALQPLVANEMKKARLLSGDKVPSYPVIKGTVWPEQTIRASMKLAEETHDGIILQGTDALFTYPPAK